MSQKPTVEHRPGDDVVEGSAGSASSVAGGESGSDHAAIEARAENADGAQALDTDDQFHLLQNERRRRVVEYLRQHESGRTDGVDMRDVVEAIAAEEHDTSVKGLSSTERQRVYIALYQSHLPKLDDYGIVEYDQDRGWLRLTDTVEELTPFLDIVHDTDENEARGLRLAAPTILAVGTALAVSAMLDVPPIRDPSLEAAGAIVVITVASAVALWDEFDPLDAGQ